MKRPSNSCIVLISWPFRYSHRFCFSSIDYQTCLVTTLSLSLSICIKSMIREHYIILRYNCLTLNNDVKCVIFTALHGMQMRSSDDNSVRLSVRQSNAWIDETEEKSVHIFIPYEKSFSLVFWRKKWLVGRPFYPKFWIKVTALEINRRFSVDIRSQRFSRNT